MHPILNWLCSFIWGTAGLNTVNASSPGWEVGEEGALLEKDNTKAPTSFTITPALLLPCHILPPPRH